MCPASSWLALSCESRRYGTSSEIGKCWPQPRQCRPDSLNSKRSVQETQRIASRWLSNLVPVGVMVGSVIELYRVGITNAQAAILEEACGPVKPRRDWVVSGFEIVSWAGCARAILLRGVCFRCSWTYR